MPTNNVSGGNIAGTKAAGDDPPVRKKKDISMVVEDQGNVVSKQERWMIIT